MPSPRPRRSRRATSSGVTPTSWASRPCAGPACWRRSAPWRARSPSPARTARPPPRRCSCSCWPRPGCRRASSSAATSPTPAPGRSGPAASCSSSRPTRATAPTSSCRCTPPCSPTSRSTTSTTTGRSTPSSTASTGICRTSPGPKVLCADDARCRDLADRHGAVTYGLRAGADVPRRRRHAERRLVRASPSSATARRWARSDLPLRGVHNVVNATGVVAMALELGVSFADCRRGARPLRRRGPSLRHPRRRRRRHVRRRLRPPAERDRGGARRGPPERRRLGPRHRRLPAQPLQPDVRDLRRLRRRLRRRRRGGAHRDLRVRHDADPRGHRPPRRRRRAARPIRTPTSCGCRGATTWSRSWPARSGPATCASRWAVETSPRSPRKCSPAAGAATALSP